MGCFFHIEIWHISPSHKATEAKAYRYTVSSNYAVSNFCLQDLRLLLYLISSENNVPLFFSGGYSTLWDDVNSLKECKTTVPKGNVCLELPCKSESVLQGFSHTSQSHLPSNLSQNLGNRDGANKVLHDLYWEPDIQVLIVAIRLITYVLLWLLAHMHIVLWKSTLLTPNYYYFMNSLCQ